MNDSIFDIESGLDKIEGLIKTLRDERDGAREEAAGLRRSLDEREMELLQMDDELQKIRRENEELAGERKIREEMEGRLMEVALKVKNILPLVTDLSATDAPHEQAGLSEHRV